MDTLYGLNNRRTELDGWHKLVEQHKKAGTLLILARAVLTYRVGIWFVIEHTHAKCKISNQDVAPFDELFRELGEHTECIDDIIQCWELFACYQADPAARDLLSWFYPTIATHGLRTDAEVVSVLKYVSGYADPDHEVLGEFLQQAALHHILKAENTGGLMYLLPHQITEVLDSLAKSDGRSTRHRRDKLVIDALCMIQNEREEKISKAS